MPCAPSFSLPPQASHCCGLLVSSPGPCASSGGHLPEALFMVFLLDSKGAKVYLLPTGLAALLRSAGFFSGVVFFARMTLARSAFHGFQVGVRRCKSVHKCKSCRSRQELSNEYLLSTCKLWRRFSRGWASQSLPNISHKLEKEVRKKHRRVAGRPPGVPGAPAPHRVSCRGT